NKILSPFALAFTTISGFGSSLSLFCALMLTLEKSMTIRIYMICFLSFFNLNYFEIFLFLILNYDHNFLPPPQPHFADGTLPTHRGSKEESLSLFISLKSIFIFNNP